MVVVCVGGGGGGLQLLTSTSLATHHACRDANVSVWAYGTNGFTTIPGFHSIWLAAGSARPASCDRNRRENRVKLETIGVRLEASGVEIE